MTFRETKRTYEGAFSLSPLIVKGKSEGSIAKMFESCISSPSVISPGTPSLLILVFVGILLPRDGGALLSPEGVKCGERHCNGTEYCSRFDQICKPCSIACAPTGRNYMPKECVEDCQEYLRDQRYLLRSDFEKYDQLRDEVEILKTILYVTVVLSSAAILLSIFLLDKTFACQRKIGNALRKIFAKKWFKRSRGSGTVGTGTGVSNGNGNGNGDGSSAGGSSGGGSSNNNNNNSSNNKNVKNKKAQEDVELGGASRQNGLRIVMPTISATIGSTSQCTLNTVSGTPNTTSTPLSRRHPSEDTTLDYAYDNPAMTPSPDAGQLSRTKRESSF